MDTRKISIVALAALLFMSCGSSNKKEEETSSENTTETAVKVGSTSGNNLEQHGDYTNLYATSSKCKISAEEIAMLYGIDASDMKETLNGPSGENYSCTYLFTLNDGINSVFGLTFFKRSMDDVHSEINNWKTDSYAKNFLRISNSGDHYIWKHPNQGYFILHNPNYANGIKIQYGTMFKLSEAQSEYLEQKGIEAIDYLIEKYKH